MIHHFGQFLLDLAQAVSPQLKRSLIERGVGALAGDAARIHVPQINDFLAEAGEMFRDIRHLLNHTPYLQIRPFFYPQIRRLSNFGT